MYASSVVAIDRTEIHSVVHHMNDQVLHYQTIDLVDLNCEQKIFFIKNYTFFACFP